MYKLVIVEDEDNIRNSLERYFPWGEIGFEVVQSFSDGFGAVEYVKENPCDVVLTDIRMERMDGLEMIQSLCNMYPDIKFVILSGYSNFEFAQQALRFRVVDYLLKPVDEEVLLEVFQRLKQQLDDETKENLKEDNSWELRKLLQQTFFRNLLKGHLASINELLVYLQYLGIDKKCIEYPLMAFRVELIRDGSEDEKLIESDSAEVANALHQFFSSFEGAYQCFVYAEWDGKWDIATLCKEARELEELQLHCEETLRELFQNLKPRINATLEYSLIKRTNQVRHLLTQAEDSERYQKVVLRDDEQTEAYPDSVLDYKLLVLELNLDSQKTVCHIIDEMLFGIREKSIEQIKFFVQNLYTVIEAEYEKRKINIRTLTNGKFCCDKFNNVENFEHISMIVEEDFNDLCEVIDETRLKRDQGVVDRIIKYMNEHISEELTHIEIAEKFKIHPGYLSRVFKEFTGETVSGYYSRIKIERAAKLLKEDHYKINEICFMLGYCSTSHFAHVFRKYSGYSPREYRQRIISL